MNKKWIYWLEELSSDFNDVVGKKCANLGEMTQLGLRVPPGFAISVEGYEQFMEESGAAEQIQRYVKNNGHLLGHVEKKVEASRAIREFIETKSMPAIMAEELYHYYATLCDRAGMTDMSVAVRSSGAVSMPGQMETFLNVRGRHDVERTVIKVWGSSFTTRAIAFRLENGLAVDKVPIGVGVLKMINAKCAGVVLTVLPTTGDTRKVIVEGNWGLGESVVSGEITPDQFIVDKECGDYECVISTKTKMVCYHSRGTCVRDVPKGMQCEPCLSKAELEEITRTAKEMEAHFNVPQDMEWVIDQDLSFPQNVFWVQARPAKYFRKKQDDAEYLADLMSRIFRI